jgi:uncharacterized protein (TIGR00369 family)
MTQTLQPASLNPAAGSVTGSDALPTLLTGLTGFLGLELLDAKLGRVKARLVLRDDLMLARGNYLHAGTVAAFADSCAGYGCWTSLPPSAGGFTTGELKINLVATTQLPDALICVAQVLHAGHRTQVWDATVTRERDGREIAYYRCTQHLLPVQR